MDTTSELSFILRPSNITGGGVGIFALHDIDENVLLDIWPRSEIRLLHESEIPKELIGLCVAKDNDMWSCPPAFNKMEIGWHLNHSEQANVIKREDKFFSSRSIKKDEELLLDYKTLEEPEEKREDYYR